MNSDFEESQANRSQLWTLKKVLCASLLRSYCLLSTALEAENAAMNWIAKEMRLWWEIHVSLIFFPWHT